jgi:hypothetical protein
VTDRLHDQATEAIPLLTDELLTEVLPEINAFGDTIVAGSTVTYNGGDTEDETEYIGLLREQLDEILMTAFTMGLILGQSDEESSDIVVGIAPEDAARITAGLFANGTTITLSVVRDRDQ